MRQLLTALLLAISAIENAQAQVITTFAGAESFFPADPQVALQAPIGQPWAMVRDAAGNVYVADTTHNQILRFTANLGNVVVFAGNGIPGYSGDGGDARSASLNSPRGLAVSADGSLYIADGGNHRVRRVQSSGIITTVAGTGRPGSGAEDLLAVDSALNGPTGVAVDSAGSILISDTNNHRIRRIGADGRIRTFAGIGAAGSAGNNVPALQAQFRFPLAIHFDPAGNLFIADDNNKLIRRVDPQGSIVTVAGTTVDGYAGDGQNATTAAFRGPRDARPDAAGGFLISDHFNSRVRRVNAAGRIDTVAGNGTVGFSGDGGPATEARLARPNATLPESSGNFLIADALNRRVRRVMGGVIDTVAGIGLPPSPPSLPKESAILGNPTTVRIDGSGNVYVTDREHSRILRIAAGGAVTTIAGTGVPGYSGDGGQATAAQLNAPFGLALHPQGAIYFTDFEGDRVRRIEPSGVVTTAAGNGIQGFNGDGPATQRSVNHPRGLALDAAGNLYIADFGNNRIRRLTPSGQLETVAGTGVQCPEDRALCFNGDNRPAIDTNLHWPSGILVAPDGTLYFSDTENHVVRRFTVGGNMTIVAGTGQEGSPGENVGATTARLHRPTDLARDAAGNLYIADSGNHAVRVVSPAGSIRTFAGTGQGGFSGDGGLAASAWLNTPIGLAVDTAQNLFIADSGNGRIRQILAIPPVSLSPSPAEISLEGISLGGLTERRSVELSASLAGLGYSVIAANDAPWVNVSSSSGIFPASLQVWADPSSLAPGTYRTSLIVSTPAALPPARSIAVTLRVGEPVPPKIVSSTRSLAFASFLGSSPATQSLSIAVEGSGMVELSYALESTAGQPWLQVKSGDPTAIPALPALVRLTADPSQLKAHTYSAILSVKGRPAQGGEEQALKIPVSLVVTEPKPLLSLSKEAMTFDAVESSVSVPAQILHVFNSGQGSMRWTAGTETLSGGAWLRIGATEGTVQRPSLDISSLPVSVDTLGLRPGTYFGAVKVANAMVAGQSRFLVVQLNVLTAGSAEPPEVLPSGLVFSGLVNDRPGSQTVTIANRRSTPISFTTLPVTPGGRWLRSSPASATIPAGGRLPVSVQADFEQLAAGISTGSLFFRFDDGVNRGVDIVAAVQDAAASSESKSTIEREVDCSPEPLLLTLLSGQSPLRVRWGQPFNMEFSVTDGCARPIRPGNATGVSAGRFSTGEEGGSFAATSNGQWVKTFVLGSDSSRSSQTSTVKVAAIAEGGTGVIPVLRGSTNVSFTVAPSTNVAPQVERGVNGANYEVNAPLSPGAVITLFGRELGPELGVQPTGAPTATNLGGTEVILGERAVPLLYASEDQINALVPFDVEENSLLQIRVRRSEAMSVPALVPVAAGRPAIFTANQTGEGLAVANNQDGSRNGPDRPAPEGSVIVVLCTGLGRLSPPIPTGQPAPLSQLSYTVNPVTAMVNGIPARVQFAGAAPGLSSVYQVNLTVPAGAAARPEAALILQMEGQESQPVLIHVSPRP